MRKARNYFQFGSVRNQKGFAMLFSLFVMVLAAAVVGANFLNLGRHTRLEMREIKRVQTRWVAEAAVDRTFKLFKDYVVVRGRAPDDAIGAQVQGPVYGSPATQNMGMTFKEYLETNWLNDLAAAPSASPVWGDMELTVNVKKTANISLLKALFEVDIIATSKATGAQTRIVQETEVGSGKLFDFGVFYDDDLEISPGPNFTIQGPVFSNKNVYITPGPGKATTITTPDGGKGHGDYALKNAGEIYFYFKRAVAEHYLLAPAGNFNDTVRDAYPDYWKDPLGREVGYEPYSYFMTAYGSGKGYVTPAQFYLGNDPAPHFYYFRNAIRYAERNQSDNSEGRNGVYDVNHKIFLKNLATNVTAGLYPTLFAEMGLNYNDKILTTYFDKNYYTVGFTHDSLHFMSISPAYDPANSPRLLADWTPEEPLSTNPAINPYWDATIAAAPLAGLIADNQPPISISLGTPDLGKNSKHLLIEPLGGASEPLTVKNAKLESKADFVVYCDNPPTCTSFEVRTKVGADPALNAAANDLSDPTKAAILIESMKDIRLSQLANFSTAETFKAIRVDMQKVMEILEDHNIDKRTEGFIFYFKVRSVDDAGFNPHTSERIVHLVNGRKLPFNGLSVATNGRVWIEGDYNTILYDNVGNSLEGIHECTTVRFEAKACNVGLDTADPSDDILLPPAAIFSDSFGILSNSWSTSSPVVSPDPPFLLPPKAALDTIVNAAVVTGFVPSQLQKAYPQCDGIDIDKCMYDPVNAIWTSLEPSGMQFLNKANGDWVADYCPYGYDDDGNPDLTRDPELSQRCWSYKDMTTGFYYYRRPLAVYHLFESILKKEALYYNFIARNFPDLPLGPNGARVKIEDIFPGGKINPIYGAQPSEAGVSDGVSVQTMPPAILAALSAAMDPDTGDFKAGADLTNLANQLNGALAVPQQNMTIPFFLFSRPASCDPTYFPSLNCDVAAQASGKFLIRTGVDGSGNPVYESRPYSAIVDAGGNSLLAPGEQIETRLVKPNINFPSKPVSYFIDQAVKCASDPDWRRLIDDGNHPDGKLTDDCEVRPVAPVPGVRIQSLNDTHLLFLPPTVTKQIVVDPGTPGTNGFCNPGKEVSVCISTGCEVVVCGCHNECPPSEWNPPIAGTPAVTEDFTGVDYTNYNYDGRRAYLHARALPLYLPKYSGGLENLVNFQEDWTAGASEKRLRYLGALIVPWHSEELRKPTKLQDPTKFDPAYYEATPIIYNPPERRFDYNETLVDRPPPGTPNIFSVLRKSFKEKKIDV